MLWVLDASVAVKWFFTEESEHQKAIGVLEKLIEIPAQFVVPELFYTEFLAVLIRKSGYDSAFTREALKHVSDLGISTIPHSESLNQMAVLISCQHRLSFYDAIYMALAHQVQGKWLTADQKAARKQPSLAQSLKDWTLKD